MPVLLDTSVWIDHLRSGDALVTELLETGEVLAHAFVIGELALGHLSRRTEILALLGALPRAPIATAEELLVFINRHRFSVFYRWFPFFHRDNHPQLNYFQPFFLAIPDIF